MRTMKLIGAAAILSVSIAAPTFAQDAFEGAPYRHAPPTYYRSYDVPPGSYAPRNSDEWRDQQNYGFSGRDPSRVGGADPDLNPPN